MASLLSKFRIDYSALKVIPDISKSAQPGTKNFFDSLIADFCNPANPRLSEAGKGNFLRNTLHSCLISLI